MRRRLLALYCALLAIVVLAIQLPFDNRFGFPMYTHYIAQSFVETQAHNTVTAIYLIYRYYDTLFEALTLIFAIIAVIYLSVHQGGDSYE